MKRRICVLLPPGSVYSAMGEMLGETLFLLGWEASVHHRADAGALDSDVWLLAGLCQRIDGLAGLLRQHRHRKPVTVVWQLEPLPPAELSPAGERLALRIAALDWDRLPQTARTKLDRVMPFGSKLLRLIRRGLALPYSRRVVRQPDREGWVDYYVSNYVGTAMEWRWLKLAHDQGWIDHCFASNQTRVRFLRSRGISAEMIPVGYHPGWGLDLRLPRDIDVLCLGYVDRRPRGIKLRRLQESLARRGRKLTLVNGVRGATRDELLSRSRIVLSLLRVPHDLAGMRVLMGMACGALVVSEDCRDTGAFVPGEHFVTAPLDRLPEVIVHYLEHEAERERIASQGHRFVTEDLALQKALSKMLASL